MPTEIRHGEEKRMEVIPYVKRTYQESSPLGKDAGTEFEVSEGEGEPLRIANPGKAEIRAHTSADTPEGRAELARKTARVILYWPSENLAGLTLFDTPGINSVNEAVIATTYRIIPKSDLVLFVTPAKQLSDTEMEFLSGRVFRQGITRAMTVVTYDALSGELSDQQQAELLNGIRSQLVNIGREYVPVEMVNIRDRADPDPLSFILRINSEMSGKKEAAPHEKEEPVQVIDDVIRNLLGEGRGGRGEGQAASGERRREGGQDPIADSPSPIAAISLSSLETTLIRFIRENVRAGRMEKAVQILRRQIQLAQVRCSTELAAMGKTEAERRQMLAAVREREAHIRRKHESLSLEFRDELKRIQERFLRDAAIGLDRVAESYLAGFDACNSLGELQNRLNRAEIILKSEMEEMLLACSQTAGEQISGLIETYGMRSQTLLRPWHMEITQELRIQGGVFSNIPPFAVLAMDVLLFARFGPFGILADLLIRFMAGYLPYIHKILPASVAGSFLKNSVRKSVTDQFERIKADMPAKIEESFQEVTHTLLKEWEAYTDEQLDAVRKSLENTAEQPLDIQRRELLTEIGRWAMGPIVHDPSLIQR